MQSIQGISMAKFGSSATQTVPITPADLIKKVGLKAGTTYTDKQIFAALKKAELAHVPVPQVRAALNKLK